jgi:putative spermidine/putrescine transport system ATP-binding protein
MTKQQATASDLRSGDLVIEEARKRYGAVDAVDGVSLDVSAGEFVTILGPSGSGKTTLLKLIAGFEGADSGRILVDGVDVTDLDPSVRNIGMVFQNYALFPHMTVARNIAYPLAMRGLKKADIAARVEQVLSMVALGSFAERLPKQLSGGQQQRVALARAIVFRPRLLLLDEPFGALDRKLREQMQLEVRRLQRQLGLTTIFITHDQEEALVMSDRIAVMDRGRIQQIGLPHDIYESPANPFIADFIGESNILLGVVERSGTAVSLRLDGGASIAIDAQTDPAVAAGRRARVMIRPERFVDIAMAPANVPGNRVDGEVVETAFIGVSHKYRVRTPEGLELLVRLNAGPNSRRYTMGERLSVGFAASDVRLIEVL